MSALIVDLRAVRNYLEQSDRFGSDEPRQSIIDRALSDIRRGFHAYRTPRPAPTARPWPGDAA